MSLPFPIQPSLLPDAPAVVPGVDALPALLERAAALHPDCLVSITRSPPPEHSPRWKGLPFIWIVFIPCTRTRMGDVVSVEAKTLPEALAAAVSQAEARGWHGPPRVSE